MKRGSVLEGKLLVFVALSCILLILTMPLVSASLFSDIGDFFKKLFGIETRDLGDDAGELRTIGPGGTDDYTSGDYTSDDYFCNDLDNINYLVSSTCTDNSGTYADSCLTDNIGVRDWNCVSKKCVVSSKNCEDLFGLAYPICFNGRCVCKNGDKRCYQVPPSPDGASAYEGIEECRQGDWIKTQRCENECVAGECVDICIPKTCSELEKQCGAWDDGCGNQLDCGTCGFNETCVQGVCKEIGCIPKTCSELDKQCGAWDDGCGSFLDCGYCIATMNCINGTCVDICIPKTCWDLKKQCGIWDDGCGSSLDCGTCGFNETCANGLCVSEGECVISDASWSNTEASLKQGVGLQVTEENCANKIINFNIIKKEKFLGIDWLVADSDVVEIKGPIAAVWEAGRNRFGDLEKGEYYFIASPEQDPSQEASSGMIQVGEQIDEKTASEMGELSAGLPVEDNLIAYYRFNLNAKDERGFHDGQLQNGADFYNFPERGFVARFDAIDDTITMANPTDYWMPIGDMAISMWVYATDAYDEVSGNGRTFLLNNDGQKLYFGNGDGEPSEKFRLRYTSSNGAQEATSDYGITLHQWNHVIINRIGNNVYFYINSIESDGSDSNGGAPIKGDSIYIGGNPSQGGLFEGYMDSLIVYEKSLTLSEIQEIYEYEEPNLFENIGIVAHYDFNNVRVNESNPNYPGSFLDKYDNYPADSYNATFPTDIKRNSPVLNLKRGNSYAQTNVSIIPTPGKNGSTAIWFKPSRTLNPASVTEEAPLMGYGMTAGVERSSLKILPTGQISFMIFTTSGPKYLSTTQTEWEQDKWYYLTATWEYDGLNTNMELYVNNGSLQDSLSSPGFAVLGMVQLRMGTCLDVSASACGNRRFDGSLEDLMIFDRQLNQSEIQELYTFGALCSGRICSCEQLQEMDDCLDCNYVLGKDIDCSNTIYWNNGKGFDPIGDKPDIYDYEAFTGSFDGRNHKISNLYINQPGVSRMGLFASVEDNARIKNVNLENVSITGWGATAGLVGHASGDNAFPISVRDVVYIKNVNVSGKVTGTGSRIGGLVGSMDDTIIENCHADVEVDGVWQVGGLVGQADADDLETSITNSSALGNVTGSSGMVGGLVGENEGDVINSYSTGGVIGEEHCASTRDGWQCFYWVGGLLGTNKRVEHIINVSWLNHSDNPDICVGDGSIVDCREMEIPIETNTISECSVLDKPNTYYIMNQSVSPTSAQSCMVVTARDVTLDCRGYSITSDYSVAGVFTDQENTTVKNCNIDMGTDYHGFGIRLQGANNSYIYNNTLNGQTRGIFSYSSSNARIENNTANSNGYAGIYVQLNSNTNLINNVVRYGPQYGILISGGSGNTLIDNLVNSNLLHGIFLSPSSNNTLINNTVTNNSHTGISLQSSSNGNILIGNIVDNNYYSGISLSSSSYNYLANNLFSDNYLNGIYLTEGHYNNLINNTITFNINGISFSYGTYNNLINNTVTNNSNAIYFQPGSNNNIIGNIVCDNGQGISIRGLDNIIQKNKFCFNTEDAYCEDPQPGFNNTCTINNGCWGVCLPCDGVKIPVSDCDWLDKPNTNYYLTKDIFQPFDGVCVVITAENVTLDCKGHSITTSSIINIAGIYSNVSGTVIKNCNITGVTEGWGIYLTKSNDSYIFNNTLNNNLFGMQVQNLSDAVFEKIFFSNNWMSFLVLSSDHLKIIENTLDSSGGSAGIHFQSNPIHHIEILNNTIINCSSGINQVGSQIDYSLIKNNLIEDCSGSSGISVYSGSYNNITDNIVTSCESGLFLNGILSDPSMFNKIINNTFNNNLNYGVALFTGATNNTDLINNTVVYNKIGLFIPHPGNESLIGNKFCNNTEVDISCWGLIQTFIDNYCDTNNGCEGTCLPCSGAPPPEVPVSYCQNLNSPNTIYYLTQDLIRNENSNCINIYAQNITLDCKGHSITNENNWHGVYSSSPYTTIKNCSIKVKPGTFTNAGIYLYAGADNARIINNSFKNSTHGIKLIENHNSLIEDNLFGSNLSTALYVLGNNTCPAPIQGCILDSKNITIRNNKFLDNGYNMLISHAYDSLIKNNTITFSLRGIYLHFSKNITVLENNLTNNSLDSVIVISGSNNFGADNHIVNNTIYGSRDGIFVDTAEAIVEGNKITSCETGVNMYISSQGEIKNNLICSNVLDVDCSWPGPSINFIDNYCDTNDGCVGTCTECSAADAEEAGIFEGILNWFTGLFQ